MPGHPVSDAWDTGSGPDIRDKSEQYNATIVQSVDAITSRSWARTKFIILVSGSTVNFYEYDPNSVAAHDGVNVIKDTDDRAFVLRGRNDGGRIAFRAHKNGTNQIGIASATNTKVTFGTEAFDVGGYYDVATSRFTPPEGTYFLEVQCTFSAGIVDGQQTGFYIYKNGGFEAQFLEPAYTTGVKTCAGGAVVEANGTDYFEIYCLANGAGNKNLSGAAYATYFSGFKVDGVKGEDGTNLEYDIIVADITERDTHGSDAVGTRIAVSDIGDGRSAVYELLSTGPAVWSDPLIITGADGADGANGANGADGADGTSIMTRVRVVDVGGNSPSSDYEAGDAVDSVTLAENDLVLRATPGGDATDGIYLVPASGAASRLTAFNTYDSMPGCYFSVMEGTTYADTLWRCTSDKGGTLETTALVFSEFEASGGGGRELLTAARTYYVRPDGSDSNDGLTNSAGGAFLTKQKAIDTAAALDLSIYNVTIQVADGTYTGAVVLKSFVGAGIVTIRGNPTTPGNVLISVTSANCVTGSGVIGQWSLNGMKLVANTAGFNTISISSNTILYYQNIDFGAANQHISVSVGAKAIAQGNTTISGSANIHWYAAAGGYIQDRGITKTLSGTPAFAQAFAYCQQNAIMSVNGNTFSGSATGPRYAILTGGLIDTNGGGTSYLPGNSAGSGGTTTGAGWYN